MNPWLTILASGDTAVWWFTLIADAALKGSGLLVMAGITAWLLRRKAAAVRHVVWMSAFGLLLALPALTMALPAWRILPSWLYVSLTESSGSSKSTRAEGPLLLDVGAMHAAESQFVPNSPVAFGGGIESAVNATPSAVASADSAPIDVSTPQRETAEVRSATPPPGSIARAGLVIVVVWFVGCLVCVTRLVASAMYLWWSARRAEVVTDGPLNRELERLKSELGWRGAVRLFIGRDGAMPMAWGVWPSRVLVARGIKAWPESQRRAVLLHELGHVARRDPLWQLVVETAKAVYWFHPLVWLAAWRVRVEREHACDDLVLNSGVAAPDYAKHLLDIVTGNTFKRIGRAAGAAMASTGRLEGRVRSIMDRTLDRRPVARSALWTVVVVSLAMGLPLAMMRADESNASPTDRQQNESTADPSGVLADPAKGSPQHTTATTATATKPADNPTHDGRSRTKTVGGSSQDVEEFLGSLDEVADPRQKCDALIRIARLQASNGKQDLARNLVARTVALLRNTPPEQFAHVMEGDWNRDANLEACVSILIEASDVDGALRLARSIDRPYWRSHALVDAAVGKHGDGDGIDVKSLLTEARAAAVATRDVPKHIQPLYGDSSAEVRRLTALEEVARGWAHVGEFDEAVRTTEMIRAVRNNPRDCWSAWSRIAAIHAQDGNLEQARETLERVRGTGSDRDDEDQFISANWRDIGLDLVMAGNVDGAKELIDRLREDDLDFVKAAIAMALSRRGETDEAAQMITGITRDSHRLVAQVFLCRALFDAGEAQQARDMLADVSSAATAINDRTKSITAPEAILLIAETLAQQKDAPAALALIDRTEFPWFWSRWYSGLGVYHLPFQLITSREAAWLLIARAQAERGEIEGAIKTAERISSRSPTGQRLGQDFTTMFKAEAYRAIVKRLVQDGDTDRIERIRKAQRPEAEKLAILTAITESLAQDKRKQGERKR